MELSISQSELYKALQRAQGVVSTKGAMPILANVLLEATEKGLTLFATNLDIGLRGEYVASVKTPGSVTSQAKKLHDIVKELPEGDVLLKVDDDGRLRVSAGKSKFNLATIPAEEFPPFPERDESALVAIDSDMLAEMIRKTSYAISQDETRLTLNGAYFEVSEGDVQMVATDGHRLAYIKREGAFKVTQAEKSIIARKAVQELSKLIGESDDGLFFLQQDNHIMFKKGNMAMVVRLIEGVFPNYEQVIPKSSSIDVEIEVSELMHALRRVATMADEKSHMVRLAFSADKLELSSEGGELGEAKDELAITYAGERLDIGLNALYLLDAIDKIESKTAILKMNDELSPLLAVSPDDPGLMCIVMPMRL